MTLFCPVVRVGLWSILLIAMCDANVNVQEVKATFTSKTSVLSSETVIQPYSKAQCVKKCVEEGKQGRCSVAGYNTATKTCYLSTDNQDSVLASTDENSGVFVIQQQATAPVCNTAEPLLSGNNPVPDDHFTASSEYSSSWAPRLSRINATTIWCPSQAEIDASPPMFYIQVRFLNMSTLAAVQTKGEPNYVEYVSSFRLEYSANCTSFVPILDATGNNVTFTGAHSLVTNLLPTPVTALCLRLYPLIWRNTWPKVQIEVLGCPLV